MDEPVGVVQEEGHHQPPHRGRRQDRPQGAPELQPDRRELSCNARIILH